MSELLPHDTAELISCLSVPVPGLMMLRYRSALVLDALLRNLRSALPSRQVEELRFDPRSSGPQAAPSQLLEKCDALASEEIPVLILRPEPGAKAEMPELATFWKQLNSLREPLGALDAQIIVCLDEAHTAAAFHHGKDLISWCSPKFEFLDIMPTSLDRTSTSLAKAAPQTGTSPALTWQSLHPLWLQVLASGQALTADTTTRLLIPLLRAAVRLGMVTEGSALVRESSGITFRDESQRASWLILCGDLAVMQGELSVALKYFTEARDIFEYLAASEPTNPKLQRGLLLSLERLGDIAREQGDIEGSVRYFEKCRDSYPKLIEQYPENINLQREMSVPLLKLGDLAIMQGDLDGALRYFTEDKAIAERLVASDPASSVIQRDFSVSLQKLGDFAMAQGDLESALRYFTEANAISENIAARNPTDKERQRDLSVSLNKLGDLAEAKGDLIGAHLYYTEAKAISEQLAVGDPANAEWQRDLIITYERLGDIARKQNDVAAAVAHFENSRDGWSKLIKKDPTNMNLQRGMVVPLNKLGDLAMIQDDCDSALRYFTEAKALSERLAASDPANAVWQSDLSISQIKLAYVAQKKGDNGEMETKMQEGFTMLDDMKQRGLQLNPMLEQLHASLSEIFDKPTPKT